MPETQSKKIGTEASVPLGHMPFSFNYCFINLNCLGTEESSDLQVAVLQVEFLLIRAAY